MPKNNPKPKNISKKPLSKKGASSRLFVRNPKSEIPASPVGGRNPNTTPNPSLVRRGTGRFGFYNFQSIFNDQCLKIKSLGFVWKLLARRSLGEGGKIKNFSKLHLAALAGVIVIVIVIVIISLSFLPQSARSKTFTFFQTVEYLNELSYN